MAEQLDITAAEYHADPVDPLSLSATIAKILVSQSPAHAYCAHRNLAVRHRNRLNPMIEGAVLHSLLLDQPDNIVVIDADSYRTKDAKAKRAEVIEGNRTPVLLHKYEAGLVAASHIHANMQKLGINLLRGGEREQTIVWNEMLDDGRAVKCRTRLDFLDSALGQIIELKKISSADMRTITIHSYQRGYDIQYAAHSRAFNALYPEHAGRLDYIFVFFEAEPPYSVVPLRPNGAFEELGMRRWDRAGNIWRQCLHSKKWPGYASEIGALEPPIWAMADEETRLTDAAQITDSDTENMRKLYE